MKKLIEFGRKAMFYIRVLSGYEERRIRSYRLQLQHRLQQAEERKAAVRKIPEQIILSEVKRMVGDMQALNKKLEDTTRFLVLFSFVYAFTLLRKSGLLAFPLLSADGQFNEFTHKSFKAGRAFRKKKKGRGHTTKPTGSSVNQEAAINDYFKPLDQQAEEVMKTQLKGDERRKDELMEAMQRQALLEMAQAEKLKNMQILNTNKNVQEKPSIETQ